MSLKVIKTRSTGGKSFLDLAALTAKIAADVTSLVQFPPTSAAASILLTILETLQSIKSNREDCFGLARRAARLLIDLGRRMDGKWDNAPPALLANIYEFERYDIDAHLSPFVQAVHEGIRRTLTSIREFMLQAAQVKWIDRLISKSSIEAAIIEYKQQLEEASHSFQIASLIEIQYNIWNLRSTSSNVRIAEIVQMPGTSDKGLSGASPYVAEEILGLSLEEESSLPANAPHLSIAQGKSEDFTADVVIRDHGDTSPIIKSSLNQPTLPDEVEAFLGQDSETHDEYGFRRYHQSEVILRKPNKKAQGWFAGTTHADAGGRQMTIKRYDGPKREALRQWMNDVKTLRNLYHENLPQIMGYSDGKASVPFILMAKVSSQDINDYVLKALKTQTLASSARTVLKIYRDITSAALHVQQQLSLDNSQLQNFIEDATYTVGSEKDVILGLPPPKPGSWHTYRSYNLTESLVDRAMKVGEILDNDEAVLSLTHYSISTQYLANMDDKGSFISRPSDSTATVRVCHAYPSTSFINLIVSLVTKKAQQLQGLVRSLLPKASDDPSLHPSIDDLLDEDEEPTSISVLRNLSLSQKAHGQQWMSRAPVGKNGIGDFGYIPGGGTFEEFEKLGNVFELEPASFSSMLELTGSQIQWKNGFTDRQAVNPYVLPGGLEGWPIPVLPRADVSVDTVRRACMESVNDAWQYLLRNARSIADRHGIKPYNLVLITQTILQQSYKVKDFNPPPLPLPGQGFQNHGFNNGGFQSRSPFGNSPQNAPSFGRIGFNQGPPIPQIVYLFTSAKPDHEAYWTDDPMGKPRPPAVRSTNWHYSGSSGWPTTDVSYIQLDAEDFADEYSD
ncbi:hypothetical protein EW146_g3702 [Bondarzewia mesenterica]|uniref:Protein kinase domain-containing protein n=1 Tax=Bondarzewia mesenterica TaxID=1095465 RepID=A0A4S4M2J9_9AGAM|nr:hypothetical protein EW146_g3702 [Bondarzewia mesenterica]